MASNRVRKIVRIDQGRCDGCGLCVPNCAEGAIRIQDGKALLVAENLCDGLGACLGHCPQDAITIEERPADDFDHHAVERSQPAASPPRQSACPAPAVSAPPAGHSGCPGASLRQMNPHALGTQAARPPDERSPRPSMLTHWPVQLSLVPVVAPIWQDADVLICADCVPFAFPEFHEKLLADPQGKPRSIAIACPKLDDVQAHVEKLAAIFRGNSIRSVTVARMEVPCCRGIVNAAQTAMQLAGRVDLPFHEVIVGIDGSLR